MGRIPRLEDFDKIYAELRKSSMRWTELQERTGIPEKTLARRLERMSEVWKTIIKDDDGRWTLTTHRHVFDSYAQYKAVLRHSEKIASAFKVLIYELRAGFPHAAKQAVHNKALMEYLNRHEQRGGITRLPTITSELLSRYDIVFSPDNPSNKKKEFIIQHLESGYPDIYDQFEGALNLTFQAHIRMHACRQKLAVALPESSKYEGIYILGDGPELGEDPMFTSEEARLSLARSLTHEAVQYFTLHPDARELPLKYAVDFGNVRTRLLFGTLLIDADRGLAKDLMHHLDKAKKEFIERVEAFNRSRDEMERSKGKAIEELLNLEGLVNAGRPLKGVCDGCRGLKIRAGEGF